MMNANQSNFKRQFTESGNNTDIDYQESKRVCEECELLKITLFCTNCETGMCESCDKRIHNKGARKTHNRTKIFDNQSVFDTNAPKLQILPPPYEQKIINKDPFGTKERAMGSKYIQPLLTPTGRLVI